MFLIRQAGPSDFAGVFPLAQLLDSYNLPADRGYVKDLLEISQRSFQGRLPIHKARYLFVLEEAPLPSRERERVREYFPLPSWERERVRGKIVGCSLIMAKHGTKGFPHLWFSLERVSKASRTLAVHRSHQVLRLGVTEDGPTEVGGLIVLPQYRGHPESCGLQISYVRFLYMAIHPERFAKEVLVEYRGAMGAGGKSPFWERVGKVFTGLSYHKADRLSVANKEFILSLLPREPIYCALLPASVQSAIGAIHPKAKRAAHLLERIGFKPLPQIEPFDGGPYYSAPLARIRIVRQTRSVRARVSQGSDSRRWAGQGLARQRLAWQGLSRGRLASRRALVGTEAGGFFRAVLIPGKMVGREWRMGEEAFQALGLKGGETVYACPV